MKEYLKNEIKHLPMIIIVSIIFCGINTLANNHLFNSKDVDYDNSNTHIESTNVGDAIDELFDAANNFTTYDTRLQGVENKVGTGNLNTTAQNLIGGVNELNNKLTSKTTIQQVTNTSIESLADNTPYGETRIYFGEISTAFSDWPSILSSYPYRCFVEISNVGFMKITAYSVLGDGTPKQVLGFHQTGSSGIKWQA